MGTESSDQSYVSPHLYVEASDQTSDSSDVDQIEVARIAEPTHSKGSFFALNQLSPLVAPDFDEPAKGAIVAIHSEHPRAASRRTDPCSNQAVMTRFWVILIGIGVLLLVAVSDQQAKHSAPLPFPNTSRIPQVR